MSTYLAEVIADGICVVYIDDILVFGSKSQKDHVQRVRRVLKKLIECQLTLKLSECVFFAKEVEFLKHMISEGGRRPLGCKVTAIRDWLLPSCPKRPQELLGPRRRTSATTQHPCTPPTKKGADKSRWSNADWQGEPEALKAFEARKRRLTTAPILRTLRPKSQRWVTTDASRRAIGAVLEQWQDGKFRPVSFFSGMLEWSQNTGLPNSWSYSASQRRSRCGDHTSTVMSSKCRLTTSLWRGLRRSRVHTRSIPLAKRQRH